MKVCTTYKLVNKPHHSALLPVSSEAKISESFQYSFAGRNDVICRDPSIKWNCLFTSFGAEESSNQHIKTECPILCSRHVSKVIDVRVFIEIMRSYNTYIPLSGPASHPKFQNPT